MRRVCVIALGDSFHDGGGPARMSDISRAGAQGAAARPRLALDRRQSRSRSGRRYRRPRLPRCWRSAPLTFRHEPSPQPCDGEIAGHLHPQARIARRGRAVSRRCFASDGKRLRDAGLRRLCGRPQCARPRHRVIVRRAVVHRAHAERAAASTPSPRRGAWPIDMSFDAADCSLSRKCRARHL